MEKGKFAKIAWALVGYTLLVIVWGAWVRISHSGDGCGDTWPLCRGVLIPEAVQKKTWIEYTHRAMSGIYGIVVLGVFIYCWKNKEKFPGLKKPAVATFVFMVTEALLGAKLVLFGLVGTNSSVYRAFVMSLHQINSLLLVGSTVWLAWAALGKVRELKDFQSIKKPTLLLFIIAASGAWAALASTLFPAESLLSGLSQDFAGESPTLLRLRFLHPLLALSLGIYLVTMFWKLQQRQATRLAALISVALTLGVLTLLLLSPVPLKLIHLLMAHTVWIGMISYAVVSSDSSSR